MKVNLLSNYFFTLFSNIAILRFTQRRFIDACMNKNVGAISKN